MLLMPLSDRSD